MEKLYASVDVKNTGNVAGKEVVQLYISAPSKKMKKPVEELKSFAKTGLLKPGQVQTIRFAILPSDLASFDTASASWISEAGSYSVKIGASSADIKQSATFRLLKEVIVEKDSNLLVPQVAIPDFK